MTTFVSNEVKDMYIKTHRRWAANHPAPDDVVLSTGMLEYSPNSLVAILEEDGPRAAYYYGFVSQTGLGEEFLSSDMLD